MRTIFKPVIERLLEKVSITPRCWIFEGSKDENGYGHMSVNGIREKATHVAYRLLVGSLTPGMFVLHRCDNPSCVKPSHLFLGTHQDNSDDKVAKGRASSLPGSLNGRAKLTEEQAVAIRLSTDHSSILTKRYGVARSTIWRIKNNKGWGLGNKGARHSQAKLTEQQAREIMLSNEPEKSLAAKYAISRGHVSSIRSRKRWKYLTQ